MIKPNIDISAGLVENIVMFLIYKNTFSANPVFIYDAPINIVVDTYNYMKFIEEYQQCMKSINT